MPSFFYGFESASCCTPFQNQVFATKESSNCGSKRIAGPPSVVQVDGFSVQIQSNQPSLPYQIGCGVPKIQNVRRKFQRWKQEDCLPTLSGPGSWSWTLTGGSWSSWTWLRGNLPKYCLTFGRGPTCKYCLTFCNLGKGHISHFATWAWVKPGGAECEGAPTGGRRASSAVWFRFGFMMHDMGFLQPIKGRGWF